MDPIEKAIRSAFEKGDTSDPAFREKVYRSAANALDRALKANPSTTVERAITRRKALESTVAAIEAEFYRPPSYEDDLADLDFSAGNELGRGNAGGAAPTVSVGAERIQSRREGRTRGRVEPSLDDAVFGGSVSDTEEGDGYHPVAADPDARRSRRAGGRLVGTLVSLLLLALLGAGGWWLVGSGLLPLGDFLNARSPQTADGQEATTGEEESVAGPLSENQETRAWINIFNPQDPSTVTVPSGSEASVATSEGLKLLRVRSGQGEEPIRFEVGQGVLEQLAGKKAVFDIVARADTEDGGNFSVACDFGAFGECGRRRYAATAATRSDFLFEVEFPSSKPKAGGTILVDPDVTNSGKVLDIFEIRAAPSD